MVKVNVFDVSEEEERREESLELGKGSKMEDVDTYCGITHQIKDLLKENNLEVVIEDTDSGIHNIPSDCIIKTPNETYARISLAKKGCYISIIDIDIYNQNIFDLTKKVIDANKDKFNFVKEINFRNHPSSPQYKK